MMLEKKLKLALSSNDRTVIEAVFNEIYHEYYKLVYFVAGQYLSLDYDIESVCNDVFLNFFNILSNAKIVNIKYGDQGNITRILQGLLICNGYSTNGFDGLFGSGTRSAVISFQKANGLGYDGIAGQNTFKKLCS